MINDNFKDNYGKILFVFSILIFLTMLFSPLTRSLYHMDEYFTLALIKFPVMQAITITANDVHPPLYYLILKIAIRLFSIFNLDLIFMSKIVTLIPYLVILVVCAIKIRKDYGWLTVGLFVFALACMSNFYMSFLTIRMYSWAILFLVLSFIFLGNLLVKFDIKSWGGLTVFTLLGAYTHYFDAISSIVLYLMLLFILIMYNRSELKNWFVSAACLIVGYVPWFLILFNQLERVHEGYWIPQVTFDYIVQCVSYFATLNLNDLIFALAILFLIFSFAVFIIEYSKSKKAENNYILMGMLLFLFTILLGTVISYLFQPILYDRYLLPAIAVFWLAISILIGKIKNDKLLVISLVFIMILGVSGICNGFNSAAIDYNQAVHDEKFLKKINHDDVTIICNDPGQVLPLGTFLDNSNVYMDSDYAFGISHDDLNSMFNIKYSSDINKTVEESDGKVYILLGLNGENELIGDAKPDYRVGNFYFHKIS